MCDVSDNNDPMIEEEAMATISLRLPDELLLEMDKYAHQLSIPRAEYVRRALEEYNARLLEKQRRERIMRASRRVRGESMKINAEFERIERDVKY